MESIQLFLRTIKNTIDFNDFFSPYYKSTWEIKAIADNLDVFTNLFSECLSMEMSILDEYYVYLAAMKIASMEDVVNELEEEKKTVILQLVIEAKQLETAKRGDAIRFVNDNIELIFDKDKTSYDIRLATVSFIATYYSGISKRTFEFLCREQGYLLLPRYENFEKVFENNPELFEEIFPTGHYDEVDYIHLDTTLEVWRHILKKRNSNLVGIVDSRVNVLALDIKSKAEGITKDNVALEERVIHKFLLFLQQIQDPRANEFVKYEKEANKILNESIAERGQVFRFRIPVDEIVSKWKNIEIWESRLLSLTHDFTQQNGMITCNSRLSIKPVSKHPILDRVSTNLATDDYFTMSHQQSLGILESVGTGTMLGVARDRELLGDYIALIISAIHIVSDTLEAKGEQLDQDAKMLAALVQTVFSNANLVNEGIQGICYGASMYICSFSEKLLRVFYMVVAGGEKYIPINKTTFGELLSESNQHIKMVFGECHVKNLSFFLQRFRPSEVGLNIRNSLAHWEGLSPAQMTPQLVAKMLWLFTDILNTVFWYCLTRLVAVPKEN